MTDMMRSQDRFWRWNAEPMPRHKAPYKSLWVDGTGRIWVQLHAQAVADNSVARGSTAWWPRRHWAEPQVFDIIEPSGRYVGQVAGPGNIRLEAARDDQVWAIALGDVGRITVKRYRIDWGDAAAAR
jgi:hypothetical protein